MPELRTLCVLTTVAICGVATAVLWTSNLTNASAQGDAAPAAAASPPPSPSPAEKPAGRTKKAKPAAPAERTSAASSPPPGGAAPAAATAPAAPSTPPAFASDLKQHGAGTCAPQVDALAASTMGGVQAFNTVSSWSEARGSDRLVSVAIAQRYPKGTPVPYGATSVVAAPNAGGGCDSMAVQVVPSPLSCPKLKDTMTAGGARAADLAGVPLIQDASGQTLLIPTAADTCILVNQRVVYAK